MADANYNGRYSGKERFPWYEASIRWQLTLTFLALAIAFPIGMTDEVHPPAKFADQVLYWAMVSAFSGMLFWVAFVSLRGIRLRRLGVPPEKLPFSGKIRPNPIRPAMGICLGVFFICGAFVELEPGPHVLRLRLLSLGVGMYFSWLGVCGLLLCRDLMRTERHRE